MCQGEGAYTEVGWNEFFCVFYNSEFKFLNGFFEFDFLIFMLSLFSVQIMTIFVNKNRVFFIFIKNIF